MEKQISAIKPLTPRSGQTRGRKEPREEKTFKQGLKKSTQSPEVIAQPSLIADMGAFFDNTLDSGRTSIPVSSYKKIADMYEVQYKSFHPTGKELTQSKDILA